MQNTKFPNNKYYRIDYPGLDYPGLDRIYTSLYFTPDITLAYNSFLFKIRHGDFFSIPVLYTCIIEKNSSDLTKVSTKDEIYLIKYDKNTNLYFTPIILCYDLILHIKNKNKYKYNYYKNDDDIIDIVDSNIDIIIAGTTIKDDLDQTLLPYLNEFKKLNSYTNKEIFRKILNMYGFSRLYEVDYIDTNINQKNEITIKKLINIITTTPTKKIETRCNKDLSINEITFFIAKDIRCAHGLVNKKIVTKYITNILNSFSNEQIEKQVTIPTHDRHNNLL